MVWRVIRARAEPEVPRLLGPRLFAVANEPDGFVGEVPGEVIAVLRLVGLLDEVVVFDQRGVPLVRLAADETVEPVVAEPERPAFLGAAHVERVHGDVVVLANPVGAPAGVTQDLRDGAVLGRDVAAVAGEADGHLGDRAEAVVVMIAPGEKARARW